MARNRRPTAAPAPTGSTTRGWSTPASRTRGRPPTREKQLVRDHLDEINERLAAQGIRTISLADPDHVERYGLQQLAWDRNGFELEDETGAAAEAAGQGEDGAESEDEMAADVA